MAPLVTPLQVHLLTLAAVAAGQALLLTLAWGILASGWVHGIVPFPYPIVYSMNSYPTETALLVTLIATVLSAATTFCFCIAFKEALQYRMHKPISLITLTGGISIAKVAFFISHRHIRTSLITTTLFVLAKLMVSSWVTLLTPARFAYNTGLTGSELNLDTNYFELALMPQFSTGATDPSSIKIADIDSLSSGISVAGNGRALSFNGVTFNTSTGGILPVAPGYTGSNRSVQSNNTGLNFIGGLIPTRLFGPQNKTLSSNFSIYQQGLTADVTCSLVDPTAGNLTIAPTPFSVPFFTGPYPWIVALSFCMSCTDGVDSKQDYVVRANNPEGNFTSAIGIMATLVCAPPADQSELASIQFNVTTVTSGKYQFLQTTTCAITPKLTRSLVSYADGSINVSLVNSTAFTTRNGNLTQYLVSLINSLATKSQSLDSNAIGDALYSASLSAGGVIDGPTDPTPILEQHWRSTIEFAGTYLRSGFYASNQNSTDNSHMVTVTGHRTITTMGWTRQKLTNLYTVLPMTFFALLTYVSIGYALLHLLKSDLVERGTPTVFDPSNPIHLVTVASTRAPGENGNLEGEVLGGLDRLQIRKNGYLEVQLENVGSRDGQVRKRFKLLTPVSQGGPDSQLAKLSDA